MFKDQYIRVDIEYKYNKGISVQKGTYQYQLGDDGELCCPEELKALPDTYVNKVYSRGTLFFRVVSTGNEGSEFREFSEKLEVLFPFPDAILYEEAYGTSIKNDTIEIDLFGIGIDNARHARLLVYIFTQQLNEIIGHNVFNVVDHEISQLIEGNNPHSDLPHWTKKVAESQGLDLSIVR